MDRIAVLKVKAALRKIATSCTEDEQRRVAAHPVHARHGVPWSLTGRVLHSLGASIGVLKGLDAAEHTQLRSHPHPWLRRVDPIAVAMLCHAQTLANRGYVWRFVIDDTLDNPSSWAFARWRIDHPWLAEKYEENL